MEIIVLVVQSRPFNQGLFALNREAGPPSHSPDEAAREHWSPPRLSLSSTNYYSQPLLDYSLKLEYHFTQ